MQLTAFLVAGSCLGFAVFTYLGLPVVLRLLPQHSRRRPGHDAPRPHLLVVICCYNEADSLRERVRNVLAQDYPGDKLRVLVIDDGSTDRTPQIAARLAAHDARVSCFVLTSNRGKNEALNAALVGGRFDTPLLCFTDADACFAPGALTAAVDALLRCGAGLAGGAVRYGLGQGGAHRAEGAYWRLEKLVRSGEGRLGRLLSAPGQLTVVRSDHLEPLPAGVNTDMAMPLVVLAQGGESIYVADAEVATGFPRAESAVFGRRRRTVLRALTTIGVYRSRLPAAARALLFWHKTARFCLGIVLTALLVTSLIGAVLWSGWIWQTLFWSQALFYSWAAIGGRGRLALPRQFVLQHGIALLAVSDYLRGRRVTRWQPPRSVPSDR